MTYLRPPRSLQPPDERSGRYILAAVLPSGRPTEPRKSTPPSPAKARAYREAQSVLSEMWWLLLYCLGLFPIVLLAIGIRPEWFLN